MSEAHPEPCIFSCGCVRGLKAEIERLREINEGRMLDILSDENVRMRAEIERLQAELADGGR